MSSPPLVGCQLLQWEGWLGYAPWGKPQTEFEGNRDLREPTVGRVSPEAHGSLIRGSQVASASCTGLP